MCKTPLATVPRPRWRGLYLRMLVAAGAGVLTTLAPLAPAPRTGLACVIVTLAAVAALGWLRANAAALDQAAWCDCAARTLRIRVVAPAPP